MEALIEFGELFQAEHFAVMLVMFLLGLSLGAALWFRRQTLIDEAIEAKERAENHSAERERALDHLRKEQQNVR